jgi:hypothetical protein
VGTVLAVGKTSGHLVSYGLRNFQLYRNKNNSWYVWEFRDNKLISVYFISILQFMTSIWSFLNLEPFFYYWSHPDVFSLSIPSVSSVKTQLFYCQLKWRHVSAQGVIIRPIIETCMRYIKWKCTFLGSQNVYNSERTWVQMRLLFTILYILKYIHVINQGDEET